FEQPGALTFHASSVLSNDREEHRLSGQRATGVHYENMFSDPLPQGGAQKAFDPYESSYFSSPGAGEDYDMSATSGSQPDHGTAVADITPGSEASGQPGWWRDHDDMTGKHSPSGPVVNAAEDRATSGHFADRADPEYVSMLETHATQGGQEVFQLRSDHGDSESVSLDSAGARQRFGPLVGHLDSKGILAAIAAQSLGRELLEQRHPLAGDHQFLVHTEDGVYRGPLGDSAAGRDYDVQSTIAQGGDHAVSEPPGHRPVYHNSAADGNVIEQYRQPSHNVIPEDRITDPFFNVSDDVGNGGHDDGDDGDDEDEDDTSGTDDDEDQHDEEVDETGDAFWDAEHTDGSDSDTDMRGGGGLWAASGASTPRKHREKPLKRMPSHQTDRRSVEPKGQAKIPEVLGPPVHANANSRAVSEPASQSPKNPSRPTSSHAGVSVPKAPLLKTNDTQQHKESEVKLDELLATLSNGDADGLATKRDWRGIVLLLDKAISHLKDIRDGQGNSGHAGEDNSNQGEARVRCGPRFRAASLILLHAEVRKHAMELLHRDTRSDNIPVVNAERTAQYERTKRKDDGPTIDDFALDLIGPLGSPWNMRAKIIFAESFVIADYSCKDKVKVRRAFKVHLTTLRRQFKKLARDPAYELTPEEVDALKTSLRTARRRERKDPDAYTELDVQEAVGFTVPEGVVRLIERFGHCRTRADKALPNPA
ncbi:hypothetical protein EVJ58_g8060, partial [Rhodofomes roseus]